jgi:hypothetical protein
VVVSGLQRGHTVFRPDQRTECVSVPGRRLAGRWPLSRPGIRPAPAAPRQSAAFDLFADGHATDSSIAVVWVAPSVATVGRSSIGRSSTPVRARPAPRRTRPSRTSSPSAPRRPPLSGLSRGEIRLLARRTRRTTASAQPGAGLHSHQPGVVATSPGAEQEWHVP